MFALIDCNNFYASCERVFDPKLEGKPILILSNNDGCIIARSNEAKAVGIEMGIPYFKAKDLVERHKVRVFSSNYTLYGDMSWRVMQTLHYLTPDVEIYSVDEAFLDLTHIGIKDLTAFGQKICDTIKQWTGIPVSVGIGKTKTLAKVANHLAKKQVQYHGVLALETQEKYQEALRQTPVGNIWGVGHNLARKFKRNGIHTALQLSKAPDIWVRRNTNVIALRTVRELRGEPCMSLKFFPPPKKSIASTRSFSRPLTELEDLKEAVASYANRAARKLRNGNMVSGAVLVFLKTNQHRPDQSQYMNSLTIELPAYTCDTSRLITIAHQALERIYRPGFLYKKAGVMLLDLRPAETAPQVLFAKEDTQRQRKLMATIDTMNDKLGKETIRFAAEGTTRSWRMKRKLVSPAYTTRWQDLKKVKVAAKLVSPGDDQGNGIAVGDNLDR